MPFIMKVWQGFSKSSDAADLIEIISLIFISLRPLLRFISSNNRLSLSKH